MEAIAIERILVSLDASPHSLAALQAAVDLAARFQAELAGLYVEDENLLRLASLPFVQEVGQFSAIRRRIESREMERQIRVQSRRVRRVFTVTAERARVRRSFQVVRGRVPAAVLNAATEADMLVLGRAGWSLLRRRRLGSTVRSILPERFGLALVLKEGTLLEGALVAVYDGSSASARALLVAETLRQHGPEHQVLIVLLLTTEGQEASVLRDEAATLLGDGHSAVAYRSITGANVTQLASVLEDVKGGLLILPARSSTLQNTVLITLLEQMELPVLLVT